jgi:hypothetical protein
VLNRYLAAAGVLFVVYPLVRPWGDATPDGMAAAFASPYWLLAHMAAMAAFVLVGVGLTRLPGRAALVTWVAGTALVLPYYGAEAFALHALAGEPDVAALAEKIRMGATQMTVFGAGLGLLAVAGVLTAIAVGRAGVVFAAGMVLYLPQFFADPALRIAHGVLLAIGCLILAAHVNERAAASAG